MMENSNKKPKFADDITDEEIITELRKRILTYKQAGEPALMVDILARELFDIIMPDVNPDEYITDDGRIAIPFDWFDFDDE